MDLSFDLSRSGDYTSASQIARVLSESWFGENMYCPACSCEELETLPNNTKVMDFRCPECGEPYQLKASSKRFGNTIVNSEYYTKIRKIKAGETPNWSLLEYDIEDYFVKNLMVIPRHFLTPVIIQKRAPLSQTARRAGWTGSNVLIGRLPDDAKLYVIRDEKEVPRSDVIRQWKRFEFMRRRRLNQKGWINDVLYCIRRLDKEEFTLSEMYDFEDYLSGLYPRNRHVKDKIRQQLQYLRDEGIIEFVGRGEYRVK